MENEEKINNKGKKVCIVIGVLILLAVAFGVAFRYTPLLKEELANSKYGMEFCPYYPDGCLTPWNGDSWGPSLTVVSAFNCELCGRFSEYISSPTPIICDYCAEITNRCEWCGRLEKE